jgi:hypothetical protein
LNKARIIAWLECAKKMLVDFEWDLCGQVEESKDVDVRRHSEIGNSFPMGQAI